MRAKVVNDKIKITVDALGLICPLPVLKLKKALKKCAEGEIVKLIVTDPAASIDVPHFCNESGNIFIDDEVEKNFLNTISTDNHMDNIDVYFIKKRGS